MARHEINIELRANGSNAVSEFGKVGKASRDLIVNVKKIGNVFGEIGGNIGGLFQNILKGGAFGIMQSVVALGVNTFQRWRDSAKEAAEAASKAAKETADSIKSSVSAISSTMSTGISSVDKYTTSLIKQLDATRQLAVAEKELEKQRAIASGDSAAAARADEV